MKRYIKCFKKENLIYKIITIGLLAFVFLFFFKVINNSIEGLIYPKERYELVNVRFTQSFIDGNNPFFRREKVAYGTEPPVVYEYAFFNSLVCALVSLLIGGNTLIAHYIVSFLAMVGTGLLGAALVGEKSKTTVGPTLCFVLLLFCHWRYGYISAAPDSMGLFLSVLVLYIATRDNFKYKELLCSLGVILIFYTKQYMVGICFSLFIYFLMVSRKSAIKFLVLCLILTPISVIVVTLFLPYYWEYSVLFLLLGSQGHPLIDGLKYVLEQFSYLSFIFAGMYIVAIVWIIKKCPVKNENGEKNFGGNSRLFLVNIVVQIILVAYFARNDGTYLTYFLQMLFPSVVIFSTIALENTEWSKIKWVNIIVCAACVLFTVYFGWHRLPMHSLSDEEKKDWQEAYSLLDENRDKGEIAHYFSTSIYGYYHGDSLFQTGHDGCLNERVYNRWNNSSTYKKLFPEVKFIMEEEFEYRDIILDRIKAHQMSVVVRPSNDEWYVSEELLKESGYAVVKELNLAVGNMIYPTEFWQYNVK